MSAPASENLVWTTSLLASSSNTVRVFLIAPEATALLRLYPITLSLWHIQDHLGPLRQQLPGPMRKLTATNQHNSVLFRALVCRARKLSCIGKDKEPSRSGIIGAGSQQIVYGFRT